MQPGDFPEFFDSSMLGTFKSCAQKFHREYLEHWKPRDASVHLHAGGAFAKGVETTRRAFYEEGKSADEAIALGLQALLIAYGDFDCPPDSAKSAERMAGAFEFYWSNYPLDQETSPVLFAGGKHAIEYSFAEPLPIAHPITGNPILYVGRLDAILNYAGGQFIVDEKTTSRLGSSWSQQWDLRSQFTGYVWACGRAGIKVDGAIVRGVSILKTKYETQEAISYRPEWQVERWFEELLLWVEDIKICFAKGKWRHNLDHACTDYGGCPFTDLCRTQTDFGLETHFERRLWNPLERTETKL